MTVFVCLYWIFI